MSSNIVKVELIIEVEAYSHSTPMGVVKEVVKDLKDEANKHSVYFSGEYDSPIGRSELISCFVTEASS